MTEVDVLEQYAQALHTSHRAKAQLRRSVQAHQAAVDRLSAAELQLQSSKQKAADELHQHMRHLQKKLSCRFKHALSLLEQEYQLQQLPLKATTELLQNSVCNLEQSAAKMQLGLQQQQTPGQAVQQYTSAVQDIHRVLQKAQAVVDHSSGQAAATGKHGFESVLHFKQLRVTSRSANSSRELGSDASSYVASHSNIHPIDADYEDCYRRPQATDACYNSMSGHKNSKQDFSLSRTPVCGDCPGHGVRSPATANRISVHIQQKQQQQQQGTPSTEFVHDSWRCAAPPMKQQQNISAVQSCGCTA